MCRRTVERSFFLCESLYCIILFLLTSQFDDFRAFKGCVVSRIEMTNPHWGLWYSIA